MNPAYSETAVTFACAGDALVGVLTLPAVAPAGVGVVIVVGGPQYRVGSHRQFVLLARRLASAGFAVLRFDCRGMGDSEGICGGFERIGPDIGAAIDALQRPLPSVRRVVLWGLCDGASAALLYCHETRDARVAGLCVANPWVRSPASLARTHLKHYYGQRLLQRGFWAKLARGGIAFNAAGGLLRNLGLASMGRSAPAPGQLPFQQRMASAWRDFRGELLLLLSDDDYTAKEFVEHVESNSAWAGTLVQQNLTRHRLPGADHTFSRAADRSRAEELTLGWLECLASDEAGTRRTS